MANCNNFAGISVLLSAVLLSAITASCRADNTSGDYQKGLSASTPQVSKAQTPGQTEEVIGTEKHVLPHPRQIKWQKREFICFFHFGMNTFTDREWGQGTEDPKLFNPTALDVRQWVRICKEAGMKMVILTAKHHDGFCLWPSKYTEHSIKNSPYKNGQGDIVKELAQACRDEGMDMGLYLSPWDRHEPVYGDSPKYNEHYMNQLRELLTNYGPVYEVWFDGACGEGPNGKKQGYDFTAYRNLVRELAPDACMFADDGPDCRWVGNENGFAGETNWSMLRRSEFYPGCPNSKELTGGHIDGTDWVPAECDVSIRPGWFYHTAQDSQVKSLEQLLEIYYGSVGRNGVLLLNLPPDKRGMIHENDARRLKELRAVIDETFRVNLTHGAKVMASNVRSGGKYAASNLADGDYETFWATDNNVKNAVIEFELGGEKTFNVIMLQEYIEQGQRVEKFSVEAFDGQNWFKIADGTTIGYKRLLRTDDITSARLRLSIEKSQDCPVISEFGLFRAPVIPSKPVITRGKQASESTLDDIVYKAANVTPSARQLAWQELEFTAFIHFGVNTFTDREWGDGKEDPAIFNPVQFDADQWVKACKAAGMKGLILTAKHHDGFCLWPSRYTEHSIKNSPYKNGQGDIVKEVSDACRRGGIRFGVYLSPWDRHEPTYGDSPKYNEHFRKQLTELLTNYGPVYEVWFDGACGEGPNGKRQVYDFESYYQVIRSLQPDAVISIVGPDVRWCGNEAGHVRQSEWSVVPEGYRSDDPDIGGMEKLRGSTSLRWYPAQVNTSIRPGWFYHASQDDKVKSLGHLLDVYYGSAGGNAQFLLNLPPDKRGLIHENDVKRLNELGEHLRATFSRNLAAGATAKASAVRDGLDKYSAGNILDGSTNTYWTTDDGVETAVIEIDLGGEKTFNRAMLQEHIRTGQRIEEFSIEAWDGRKWSLIAQSTVIGSKRLLKFEDVTAGRVRINILKSRVCPTLAEFGLYRAPPVP